MYILYYRNIIVFFRDKVALITGGGSGIGFRITEILMRCVTDWCTIKLGIYVCFIIFIYCYDLLVHEKNCEFCDHPL